ncbi:MAG: L-histidine N(alpha)-methyltransferase [Gemmatimonadetes bacterium]|nr:L-histidine N(alpha)-methyltransferase [Gemmatimonadota bacterium]
MRETTDSVLTETRGSVEVPRDPHDRSVMLADVLAGLRLPQKELSPKYFYDTRGSELFEQITRLDEYYPTRMERSLLEQWMPIWVDEFRPAALVELGAGSAEKSRIVLDAMSAYETGKLYVPVDVSGEFLHDTARRLRVEYDGLQVEPEVADITETLEISVPLPRPSWLALLGSTIGNFDPVGAVRLLCRVARQLRPGDRFLMGADLRPGSRKTVQRVELAYNDAAGVTAEFNLNVLRVLNRELGADFDLDAFEHRAFYAADHSRIEMHLEARSRQVVKFPNGAGSVRIARGESIRTEISCKYDRPTIECLFSDAGLSVERWVEDSQGFFALILATRAKPGPVEPFRAPTGLVRDGI